MTKKYITPKEYAEYYHLTIRRIWYLLRHNRIPGVIRVGKRNWLLQRRFRPMGSSGMAQTLKRAEGKLSGIRGSLGKEDEDAGEIIADIDLPPIPLELQRPILPDE